ncbi:MAG: demethoxyubiquinone hydroxylase family protein [Burkholderiales bacterium]|jgi:demethoxyubiquinone hydroxylase (CLK1/Coq7/Cat5 family)/predicted DCC family thiol-disulfide oxidoreductase YuxK|uniref:demethoxyubiquinone hydroxylase family protein n=1 Tax=Limnobacter sp. TaxID=2003368 RepID=UPI0039BD1C7C|nr:demethoxyubiquinone hydroxylase family protein [Burkholderiales bacterium]
MAVKDQQVVNQSQCVEVYFDGSCPMCRREIAVYQNITPDQPISWIDVSKPETQLPQGQSKEQLMARFHTRTAQGELLNGAAAFVHVWAQLPGWRVLAWLAKVPGMLWFMEKAYNGFLPVRPAIQRFILKFDTSHLPPGLVADIRTDHAGETGAVWIYKGILAVSRIEEIRAFASEHLQTEQRHLKAMNELLPVFRRSWLLVPWRIAGFITGALPAMFGPVAVYRTIAAVETFVNLHYQEQIEKLNVLGTHQELRSQLIEFQLDECAHRDEAASKTTKPGGVIVRLWVSAVGTGSKVAVTLARFI